nr:hypothetical protein [Tanacetum cinerariifolium]
FLAYASFIGFMVYQIDIKSAFLYGTIEEEVYVYQPPGFEDPDYPGKVYKGVKALYGLHQAPRAWSRLVPLNAARPVITAVPKSTVKSPRPVTHIQVSHGLGSQKTLSFLFDVHGNPQQALKDKGVIDSGCSRHMTGNISYLSYFKEINGGYAAFGGNPKGGKITGKDTECVVLSSDFKPPDENHMLLRVPIENNMYNVDLKNVVPSGDLTCLFAKATLDESNLWYRRLGYINLKTMNKLVKGNLVRGLPSKVFENNHTYVACKKGKQHRASCKSKPVSSVNHPLQSGSKDPQNTYADVAFDVKENENEIHVSPSSIDKSKKHDEKAKREAKGKILVDLSTGVRDLRDEFEEFSVNETNRVNAPSAPVADVGPNLTNSTNSFNAASPSDNVVSINFEIDDEEDVGAEADFSNLETNVAVSPIKTTRVHKDHHVTQIIVELTSAPQTRSMARMEEGIDYEEVFAPVARIEAIRLFLAYASFIGFMVYQMDVKSAFLYGTIGEEVYICQPLRFKDPDYPDKELCKAFEKLMKDKFQMSSMGEHTLFLGLQVKQKDDGIFISQDKYVAKILRKFSLTDGKSASTPIDTENPLLKDPDGKDVDVHIYSDYAGPSLDRKSITGGCQFLGCRLIFWQCKKQTVVATSSTEAEYIAAASCCAQKKYILDLLAEIGMINCKPANTPMMVNQKLFMEKKAKLADRNMYQRLYEVIGKDFAALQIDDVDNIYYLPNEEIFAKLERMGYQKPSTKLTFYKVFFLAQWKFLIHTILQCMSAKRTAWNEFSSSMASAVICLATGRKFSFSKCIFDSLVRNVDSSSKFYMVGKRFSRVDTPLFERMLVPQQVNDDVADDVADDVDDNGADAPKPTPPPQQ